MNVLDTISIISLAQHNILSNKPALFDCAEADDISDARIRLLVSVCDTHTATNGNVEASKLAVIPNNGDKAEIIGENVNVIRRRYSDSNFELKIDKHSNY
jgi:hypothetical protein